MTAIIVALADDGAIGRRGDLLCHISEDLKHFKALTTGSPVIMGRRTWESLPKRPLPGRLNIVATRQKGYSAPGAQTAPSLPAAIQLARDNHNTLSPESYTLSPESNTLFIIGGGEIYRQALPLADTLYLTRIHARYPDADTHFPEIDMSQWQVIEEEPHEAGKNHPAFTFQTLIRINE